MIDRGDLSIETGIETLAVVQKHIIEEARNAAKPVIVATEMLHSMIEQSVPTKAEVSDISNAVLDGAAALMLSGETAIGRFPTHAVAVMRRVSDAVSAHVQESLAHEDGSAAANVPQGMEAAIALLCRQLPVTKIVAVTISGFAARMVASRRPRQPILAVSNDPAAARSFNLLPGTEGVYIDMPFARTNVDHIPSCLKELWRRGKLVDQDLILVTSVGYPRSGNRMNLIQTHLVSDLRETLAWDR
jgi:pyruvate kinase